MQLTDPSFPNQSKFMQKNTLLIFSVILVLFLSIVLTFFYKQNRDKKTLDDSHILENLVEENKNFSLGENFLKTSDGANALKYFQEALKEAKSLDEEAQIKYKIALSYDLLGDPTIVVTLLKEIISNTNYKAPIRAYALQYMARLFNISGDANIHTEIFKDAPYADFYKEKDLKLAYLRLYEYGSKIYPLGIIEMRIADWYADSVSKALREEKGDATKLAKQPSRQATLEKEREIIRKKIVSADMDIQKTRSDVATRTYVPEILFLKGNVLAKLHLAGDFSLGNPEDAYKESLEAAQGNIAFEAAARYHYASFLARAYGKDRRDDVKKLLSAFYADTAFSNSAMYKVIAREKNNALGLKNHIVLMASLDPEFKTLLRQMGWERI